MEINVSADVRKAKAALTDLQRRQIPYAAMLAVNDVAFQVRKAETDAIPSVLSNPRPFTRRSVQVDKANKSSLTARVFIRPEVAKYLQPYETGGKHVLPSKALLDPKGIRLDQYGQLGRTAIARLMAKPNVFKGEVRGVRGFWQRLKGDRLKLLIRFGDALPVTKHLDFRARGEALVRKTFPAAFQAALAKAIGSAGKKR